MKTVDIELIKNGWQRVDEMIFDSIARMAFFKKEKQIIACAQYESIVFLKVKQK